MLQSIEERLRHCNVLTKNCCLICTTRNDKVERRKFLAHCKVSDYLGDAMNKKSVYTSESRFFNAAHVNILWPTYSTDTWTRTFGRRLSNHNVFWKQKILNFFCIQTNNIKIFNNCSSFINCLNFPYPWGNCPLFWLISINPNSCEFLNRLRMIFLDTLQSKNSSLKIVVSCTMSFYKPNIKLRLNQKVDIYNDDAHCYSHLFASLVLPYTPMPLCNHTNNGCEWSESQPTLFLKSYKESNLTPTKIITYGSGNTLRTMYPVLFFQATAVCIHKFTKIWIEKGQSQNRAVSGKVSKASNDSKF